MGLEAWRGDSQCRNWQVGRYRKREPQTVAYRCRGLEGVKSQSEKAGDPGTTRDSADTQEIDSRPVSSCHYQNNTETSTTTRATQPGALVNNGDGIQQPYRRDDMTTRAAPTLEERSATRRPHQTRRDSEAYHNGRATVPVTLRLSLEELALLDQYKDRAGHESRSRAIRYVLETEAFRKR